MEKGRELLEAARRARDPRLADDLLIRAIWIAPDMGEAYAARAKLALHQGDVRRIAYNLRVAFARGARTPEVRVLLAICLHAVGEVEMARQIKGDLSVPHALASFAEAAAKSTGEIEEVLSHPLPKPGVPALLPGERLPRPAQTEASSTSAPPASGPPASAPPASAPPKPRTDPIQSLEPSPREPSPREPSPSKISLDAPGLAPVGLGALPPKRAPVAPFGDGPPIEDLFGAPGSFLGHPAPVVSRSAPPARRDASPPPALVVSRSAPPARRDASPPPAPVVSRSVPPVDRSPAPASSPALPQRAEPPSLDSAPPRKRHAPISVEPIALPPSAPPPPQPLSERPAPFSARPTSQPGAPQDRGKVETIRRKSERPEWLETLDAGPFNAEIETESWVEDNQAYINEVRPGRFDGTPLALAAQPAMEAPAAISPVTGQRIQAEDCPKPQLDLAPVDDLEAAHHIDPALIPRKALRLAVRIPGPVVALPGKNPRQLCKRLALAVTEDEIVLKDTDNPKVPMIRLSRRSITLFEVVNDGAQLTFYMLDGRQMHLDLRPLKARAFKLSLRVIREITRIMEA